MTQPVHTPGPVEVNGKAEKAGDGSPFLDYYITIAAEGFHNGKVIADTFNADSVFTEEDRKTNARLLAAAYNTFDSAAKKLGCNAVELAERMQDGGLLAELLIALCLDDLIQDLSAYKTVIEYLSPTVVLQSHESS